MATRFDLPGDTAGVVKGIEAFNDLASTIANPPPNQPLKAQLSAAGQQFCNFVGGNPGAAKALLLAGYPLWGLMCKPYWDDQGYDVPVPETPFFGGQCSGSEYRPLGTYTNTNAAAGPTGARSWRLNTTVVGPLSGFVPSGSPEGTSWGFVSASNGGAPFGNAVDVDNGKPVFGPNDTSDSGVMRSASAPKITDVGLQFGPDNCGDPDPVLVPGANPPPPPPYTPGFEVGVDPTGQPYFTIPDIPNPIGGEPDTPYPDPSVDPPSGGGGADPGPPEAGTPGSTGEGGEDDGEAPPDKELWALRVDIDAFPANPKLFAPGVYRAVCYVYMGDANGLDHDPAGSMLRDGQLVIAEKEGLTRYRVAANMGYDLTITPFWRTPRKES